MLEIIGTFCLFSFIALCLILNYIFNRARYNFFKECAEDLGLNIKNDHEMAGSYKGYAVSAEFLRSDISSSNYRTRLCLTLTCAKPLRGEMVIYSNLYYLIYLGKETPVVINDPEFSSNFCLRIVNMSLPEVNTILTPDIRHTMVELKKKRGFFISAYDKSIKLQTRAFNNDKDFVKDALELMFNMLKNYREIR